MGAGVSVAAGVSVGVQVDGVIHRAAPLPDLTVVLLQVEGLPVHGHQHLVQRAARGAVTTEAAHQAGQVHVQAPPHVNGKPLLTAPELHRIARQIEARPRPGVQHAVNNGKRQHKIGSRYGN